MNECVIRHLWRWDCVYLREKEEREGGGRGVIRTSASSLKCFNIHCGKVKSNLNCPSPYFACSGCVCTDVCIHAYVKCVLLIQFPAH